MTPAPFNSDLGMPESYYAATANQSTAFRPLDGSIDVDVCVVGGGCTGLSAALHAAESGLRVVLLEGGKLGWGASGRNGGQMIPGLRKNAPELVGLYGAERARQLFDLSLQARTLVLELIERHRINCDLKLTGHLYAAAARADLPHMREEVEVLHRVMNYPSVRFLEVEETHAEVAADFHGGILDSLGGHLHPLNYTLGLAAAAARAGVQIFEQSPAVRVATAGGVLIGTPAGEVRARSCILAGDALLEEIGAGIGRYIMPVANYIGATTPLREPEALIAHDRAVSDSRFVVNYFRLSADGRLLFGGGERYSTRPPADMRAFVSQHLTRVFPQLRGVALDYAWGGLVSVTRTRLPHVGRKGDILYAHGYSGLGVILSTLAGKLLAAEVRESSREFALLAGIAPPPFPGGERLRPLLHIMGMLWFAAQDRSRARGS